MPRFSDDWVVDRAMFEYVSGGTCACCGFPHLFNPEGLKGLINSVSDLETDAAADELSAAQRSPWPPEMRDQVWADRVRLRYKMKKEMKEYSAFIEEEGIDALFEFCRKDLGPAGLRRVIQMPRSEVTERLKTKYGIHSAFAIVLCAVVEQVANFGLTKYDTDARGAEETDFEGILKYDKRGPGFTLPIVTLDSATQNLVLNEDALMIFLKMMMSLGGPKLLHRAPRRSSATSEETEEDGGGADDAEAGEAQGSGRGPSFRSDRRIVRLLIARYWADQIIGKYRSNKNAPKEVECL